MNALGIEYDAWHERAEHLGLGPEDESLLSRLRSEVLEPDVDALVAEFRVFLNPLYDALPPFDRDFVSSRQRDYILHFGEGFTGDDYMNARVLIGEAHVRWSIPLSDYALSHHHLQGLILKRVLSAGLGPEQTVAMTETVCRIIALDMGLVIHAYHRTRLERLEEKLATQVSETRRFRLDASRDILTNLLNRRGILVNLDQAILEARERGQPLLVGVADLDHFKRVNDEHGHPVGDEVLRITSQRMRRNLRRSRGDSLGRWGGEEFLFVLRNTSLEAGLEVGERVRLAICKTPIGTEAAQIPLSISIGFSLLRPDDDRASLIARADEALYLAKEKGRNRVESAS